LVLDVIADAIAIGAQLEEIGLLLDARDLRRIDRPAARRAMPLGDFGFLESPLARDAVLGLVEPLVDIAARLRLAIELLREAVMARLGRADEIIGRDRQEIVEVAIGRRAAVDELLRALASGARGLLDLEPVLIETDEKPRIAAPETSGARVEIGDDLLVGVPHVRERVRIVDRRRDVEGCLAFLHGRQYDGARKGCEGRPGRGAVALLRAFRDT